MISNKALRKRTMRVIKYAVMFLILYVLGLLLTLWATSPETYYSGSSNYDDCVQAAQSHRKGR